MTTNTTVQQYLQGVENGKIERLAEWSEFEKQIKQAKKKRFTSDSITNETIPTMANAICIRALTTDYVKSGNETILKMLYGAIDFARNYNETTSDGSDLIQDVALYLCEYRGKKTTDATTDGQTYKDGNPISILRGAFRHLNRKIYGHKKRVYHELYITDYISQNGDIAIPFEWDIDNITDYITTDNIIKSLELTENQKSVLSSRMRRKSLETIAKSKGITKQAVFNTLAKIGKKYYDKYGVIAIPVLEHILSK